MPTPVAVSLPVFEAGEVDVPYVIKGFDEIVEADTVWHEHAHPVDELLWNGRGASTATVGRRTWTITTTHGLWMPAGTRHRGAAPRGTWYRSTLFGVPPSTPLPAGPVAVEITPLLRELLGRLDEPDLAAASRAITETMVLDVLEPSPTALAVSTPGSTLLAPIVAALDADPADPRGLQEWADELGVHTRTLTRAMRRETGVGFARWLTAWRAHRAVLLLARGESVDDVAATVGYSSPSAFCAAFRRVTGTTPGRFRAPVAR